MQTRNKLLLNFSNLLDFLEEKLNKKITQTELGKALSLDKSSISLRIKRESSLNENHIKKLEEYFEIEITKEDLAYTNNKNVDEIVNMPIRGDIAASLGNGSNVFCEEVTEQFPLPKSLIKKIGASPEHSCIINTTGESMYPTIIGGKDQIMIDQSKKEIFDGKVYLIRIDNSLFAKRLQKLPHSKIKVISDNPSYESYTIDLKDESIDFDIIGQIVWISRVL